MKKRSLDLKNPKLLTFIVFVLGFGAFGVYKLAFSSASSPVNISYRNYLNVSQMSSGTSKVNDATAPYSSEPQGSGQGPKYVTQIAPGGILVNDPPRSTFPNMVRMCYVMRAVDTPGGKPAVAEIVGFSSSRKVTVSPDAYREYCIADSSGPARDYNVKQLSGSPVNVLQTVWYTHPVTN